MVRTILRKKPVASEFNNGILRTNCLFLAQTLYRLGILVYDWHSTADAIDIGDECVSKIEFIKITANLKHTSRPPNHSNFNLPPQFSILIYAWMNRFTIMVAAVVGCWADVNRRKRQNKTSNLFFLLSTKTLSIVAVFVILGKWSGAKHTYLQRMRMKNSETFWYRFNRPNFNTSLQCLKYILNTSNCSFA